MAEIMHLNNNTENEIVEQEKKIVEMLDNHSKKLDSLEEEIKKASKVNEEGFNAVVSELKFLRESFISPATNENKVPINSHNTIVKTLCFVIFVLIIWFTGLQPHLAALLAVFK